MTRIYLIRHGQTTGNASNTLQGSTDCELSSLGHEQIALLSERMKQVPIEAVYSSHLTRAFQTAEGVNKYHGFEITKLPQIAEMYCGDWEKKTFEYLHDNDYDLLMILRNQPHLYCSPGGETMCEVYDRMLKAVCELAQKHRNQTIAVVSHGCAIRNFLCFAHTLPLERLNDVVLVENTSVSCVDFDDNMQPTVVFENDISHLEPLLTK